VARCQPFLIRGATLIDGSGRPPVIADVRVGAGGRVAEVVPSPRSLAPAEGEDVVDGAGRALAPGFIDLHSHSDLYTLQRPGGGAPLGDGPKLLQGCTAQVFGQDGMSAAPVTDEGLADLAASIAGLDGTIDPTAWTWRGFADYLAALRRSAATRVAALVGHSTVRRLVMGVADRPPTCDELERMQAAVDQAMAEGAVGLSTGLVYVPAAYAGMDELVSLCRVVAGRGGRFFVHVRSESDRVVEATREVLEVARRSGVHLHYSHIKTAGRSNWGKAQAILDLVSEFREAGVIVTADVHPYTAGSTTASVLLPPWMLEGGHAATLRRLADPAARARARRQLLSDTTSWDNWWAFSGGWDGLLVAGANRPGLAGRPFSQLLRDAGVEDPTSQAAFDVVFELLSACRLDMSLISFNNVEENVARFMSEPYTGIGSDALVNPQGHPHPRLYGTFPRVLGRYVRELGTMDLPGAVHAMTAGAARAAGWVGTRGNLDAGNQAPGSLAPGAPADLVLFDPEVVADRATYEEPRLAPVGIERVWVGGRPAVVGGQLVAEVPPAEEESSGLTRTPG
jgi:N-acyl-D-amino-acid deacylase